MAAKGWVAPSVLPGFGITFGYSLLYLSLIVLIPLAALAARPIELGWAGFWAVVTAPRVLAALKLSFGAAFFGAWINAVFGLITAWVLVRYEFPMKKLVDALVDLPFALPTAVAGIALTTLYAPNGNPQPGPKFKYKLAWMKRLLAHAAELYPLDAPVVLAGDFNIVPTDADIYPSKSYAKNALVQPEPRALFRRLLDQGWIDAIRTVHPDAPIYTFWDYKRNRWTRDAGLRIDHLLLNAKAAKRLVELSPDDTLAHTTLSRFYQAAGRIPEAEAEGAKARILDWKRQLNEDKGT